MRELYVAFSILLAMTVVAVGILAIFAYLTA